MKTEIELFENALDTTRVNGKKLREYINENYISNSVLDKIKAEILEEKECAYADFERYKVEYLGQDWENVCDTLPQDDFRYGMERCIDIIDKYKANKHEQKSNIKALGDDIRICQKSITDETVLIGFNMAVAICNKHLAESENKG